MIRIKICGITQLEDAFCAVDCGACALGFNFFPKSPRYITPEKAAGIIKKLPPFVTAVGLFVNENVQTVKRIAKTTCIDTIQLHGDEPPEICSMLGEYKIIKVFRIRNQQDLDLQLPNKYSVAGYLLDAFHPQLYGGTGTTFDWKMLAALTIAQRIIIAGGITPDNIGLLLKEFIPYGIDICSGVEKTPGIKDHTLIKQLFHNIKNFQN